MNQFQEGQFVYYTPRDTNEKIDYQYKVVEILPQENGEYEDVEHKENYWIQNGKEKYLVLPSELSAD